MISIAHLAPTPQILQREEIIALREIDLIHPLHLEFSSGSASPSPPHMNLDIPIVTKAYENAELFNLRLELALICVKRRRIRDRESVGTGLLIRFRASKVKVRYQLKEVNQIPIRCYRETTTQTKRSYHLP
jgi:hypothetical protein